jgi:putative nucleotidyltransferase with HDIG domain
MKLTKPASVWEIPLGKIFQTYSPGRSLSWRKALGERLIGDIAEIRALRGIRQEKKYHGEGDALEHTLLALKVVPENADERVFWAVLLHDIGKSITTEFSQGKWNAHGHAFEGSRMAERMLWRIGRSDLAADVAWLVRYHHFSLGRGRSFSQELSPRQISFMKNPLFQLLLQVEKADSAGSLGGVKDKRVKRTERFWREFLSRMASASR